MIIIDTERVPIFSWCNNIPTGTLEQAYALANLPFIFKQFDMMADTHVGYGMPIGGVAGYH
jgi:tRNA-splicing ligase RtcB